MHQRKTSSTRISATNDEASVGDCVVFGVPFSFHHITLSDMQIQENTKPIILTLHVETFPDFRIGDYCDLVDILDLQDMDPAEVYNRAQGRWDCHTLHTLQQVGTGETLLF